ncbi:uncharacterized protein DEA37_0011970 [Paragonimus westermani]|uniref:Integrase zinc-binding domain-containing protein n=1 Tax=Paragonimus westermani TaxID=34504 RepID=A0A5J4NLI9_9TREM|nr:uncharacterized protein DEA37_0011970 [Paragonimus westermani]
MNTQKAEDFNICYRRTKDFGPADAPSRPISNQRPVIAAVSVENDAGQTLTDVIYATLTTTSDTKRASEADRELQQTIMYTKTRWPSTPPAGGFRQFHLRPESLSVFDFCLLFDDHVIILSLPRQTVPIQFHCGHPGAGHMKALARIWVYWPGIDNQLSASEILHSDDDDSSPCQPQSNGQVEHFVDTFKRVLTKSHGEGPIRVLQRLLLTSRTTPNPVSPSGLSLAEALMSRKLRTRLDAILLVEKLPEDKQLLSRRAGLSSTSPPVDSSNGQASERLGPL